MIWKAALAVVVVLVLAVAYLRFGAPRIAGHEARDKVGNGALLLDVRSVEEFQSGHLEGAVNIPIRELAHRMGEVGPVGTEIVVYCASGTRSAVAKRMLEGDGYEKVYDLGGMSRW